MSRGASSSPVDEADQSIPIITLKEMSPDERARIYDMLICNQVAFIHDPSERRFVGLLTSANAPQPQKHVLRVSPSPGPQLDKRLHPSLLDTTLDSPAAKRYVRGERWRARARAMAAGAPCGQHRRSDGRARTFEY